MPPYDGSARVGKNLFTNSTIALDFETGALRWHFQTIHHDLWDWDNITGPTLFDVTDKNGETIKGVAAAGKNCLLYLWHRETGEPINPIVETPVETKPCCDRCRHQAVAGAPARLARPPWRRRHPSSLRRSRRRDRRDRRQASKKRDEEVF